MNTEIQPAPAAVPASKSVAIKVFGIGNAGRSVIEEMMRGGLPASDFVAITADAQAPEASSAAEIINLETPRLRGLGTGGDPERGRVAAEENASRLKALCQQAQVVFIVAGLGGGAGTGISPVLARVAAECGALVLAFVTSPFDCEGNHRRQLAAQGLDDLKAAADGVICLPNQKVLKLIDEHTSLVETFKITNRLLADGVRGVWRLLTHTGLIEIHFSEVCALLRDRHGESSFAVAEAAGPNRAREVLDKLLGHPMFENGQMLGESEAVLVSLLGGPDLTMTEVDRLMEQLGRQCEHAQLIMGAAVDEAFRDRLAVTLIAARRNADPVQPDATVPHHGEDLDKQLLDRTASRSNSRFVPPAPALSPGKAQELLARQNQTPGGARARKKISMFRQTQLPLEIVSKGRFDKSEPTIHRGEDLDVPTYIRRGVALN
jgi:cell division protein FtsZ